MSSMSQPRGPGSYHQGACKTCQKAKTKCSPPSQAGKCGRCERLGKECVIEATGQAKRLNSGKALIGQSPSSPKSPATSYHASIMTSNPPPSYTPQSFSQAVHDGTVVALNRYQNPSSHLSALRLVPILLDIVAVELHDLELNKSIEWAVKFFDGVFDAEVFRTLLNGAARRSEPSGPYLVQLCHWALIVRQPGIYWKLDVGRAEAFMSKIFGAWFVEVQRPTLWTLMAAIVLLDHLQTVGDHRSGYLKVLAHEMVGDPSRFDFGSSDGQSHKIGKLFSILCSRFPNGNSRSNRTTNQEAQEVSGVGRNSAEHRPMPLHPVDGCQNIQQAIQGDGRDTPPDKPGDLTSDVTGINQVDHLLGAPIFTPYYGHPPWDPTIFLPDQDNTVNEDGVAQAQTTEGWDFWQKLI
ncbi:uncharacterized protein EI90DRAFT_3031252 [Cantharellus anzutake]|uniref:uncharacterized protein n=1 Tax=Cantharellus anzutake TaxID=1750568 RepID=UPI0019057FFD|nr:uncharacterized protein EI90DRAFT_3031252 [Cantharellus anzutake]KAF8343065.1 hypothetical protein EI90DRAFT_3031252 [Cantharellus anzutake]